MAEHGLRLDVMAPEPSVTALVDALAEFAVDLEGAGAGQPPVAAAGPPAVTGAFPDVRPRRLRRAAALRRLVAQVRLHPADLIQPLFVKEGLTEPAPVPSLPGVVQHTRDSLRKAAAEAVAAGVGGLILFGVPAVKDARGSAADDPAGIVQLALADLAGRGRHRHRPDRGPAAWTSTPTTATAAC